MRLYTTLFVYLVSFQLAAQWANNPADPGLVTNAVAEQKNVQMLPDSAGGIFVFWRDNRLLNTRFDLYGQHFNAEGQKLWDTDGLLLVSESTSIMLYHIVALPDAQFSIVWQFNAPTGNPSEEGKIRCQRFNSEGEAVWSSPIVLAEMATSGSTALWIVRDFYGWTYNERLYFGWFGEAFGTNIHRFGRVDFNGTLLSNLGGNIVSPYVYAGAELLPDGHGGVYFHSYSSNSSFFGVSANRFDSLGVALWASGIQQLVPLGSMAGYHQAVADTGGITAFFASSDAIEARRLMNNGMTAWNGESYQICNAEGVQVDPQVLRKPNGEYIIVWADSRPGAIGQFAVYGQKLDANMNPLWTANGVLLSNQNTGTYSDMNLQLISDETDIYTVIQKAGNTVWATRFDENGNILSSSGDLEVIVSPAPLPVNNDFDAVMTGSHSIAAWSNSQDASIICFNGCSVTFISNTVTACDQYQFNDQIFNESGIYTIEIPGDTLLELNLTIVNFEANIILDEFTLTAEDNYSNYQWISCADNQTLSNSSSTFTPIASGEYALIASLNGCSDTTDCITVNILDVTTFLQRPIQLYPNPALDILFVETTGSLDIYSEIKVFDSYGREMYLQSPTNLSPIGIDITQFNPGIYYVKLTGSKTSFTIPWIKTNQ